MPTLVLGNVCVRASTACGPAAWIGLHVSKIDKMNFLSLVKVEEREFYFFPHLLLQKGMMVLL